MPIFNGDFHYGKPLGSEPRRLIIATTKKAQKMSAGLNIHAVQA